MTLRMSKPLVLTSGPVGVDARHNHTTLFGLRGNGSQTEGMLHMNRARVICLTTKISQSHTDYSCPTVLDTPAAGCPLEPNI